jgi:hypothetical protein
VSLSALLAARGTSFEALTPWERDELQAILLQEYLARLDAVALAKRATIQARAAQEAARLAAGGRRRYVNPRPRHGTPNPNRIPGKGTHP